MQLIQEKIDKYNGYLSNLNPLMAENENDFITRDQIILITAFIADLTEIKSSLTKPSPQY
jgi:hypothetical protein